MKENLMWGINIKDTIAKNLLKRTLNLKDTPNITEQFKLIQALASYKYDEYQQFFPGMRFIESFVLWLDQFEEDNEKKVAYEFIKDRLIFISNNEIKHLVSNVYPDIIVPFMIKYVSELNDIPSYLINKITKNTDFKILKRKSLFLGLSDGARIGFFRRLNKINDLSHEQIWLSYDLSDDKKIDMKEKLKEDLIKIKKDKNLNLNKELNDNRFKLIYLLDDFSASGTSFIRKDNGEYKGKIQRIIESLKKDNEFFSNKITIILILYIASEQAIQQIETYTKEYEKEINFNFDFKLFTIQKIYKDYKVNKQSDGNFCKIIDGKYYDEKVEDEHTNMGGADNMRYGFAKCSLPVVLNHNCPNNSIFLLWSYDYLKTRGLFPRIQRHGSVRK
ncbi:MAG: hypothetical protein GF308_10295 [Candidatus Heimdallarchaeota archaeon]|nr:hypothetical protein [Candidatus Heimdallarchaeota archaeon]